MKLPEIDDKALMDALREANARHSAAMAKTKELREALKGASAEEDEAKKAVGAAFSAIAKATKL